METTGTIQFYLFSPICLKGTNLGIPGVSVLSHMVSAYLNVALDQTIPGLLPEITPRSNRFRTNQHNLLLRASAFRQQEQRNRNTGKQEHLKTGWSETKTQECWETGTSDNSSNMKTGASENRIIWNQNTGMMENRNTRKQEHLKT